MAWLADLLMQASSVGSLTSNAEKRWRHQPASHQDRRNGSDCLSFIFLGCHLTGLASGLLLTSSKWRWLPLSRTTYLPRDRSTQFQQPTWVSLACQPSTHRPPPHLIE